jgi:hypothetical protein
MTAYNPPGWLQNAGATHTAVQMRNYISGLTAGNDGALSMRSRGGVNPSLGNLLAVTQAGAPNMTVLVKSGVAWVPGSENSVQGLYGVLNDADVTVTITAAHATLARIDIIVFKIEDSQYSGGVNASSIVAVAGTPSGSPAVPTAPNNSIILAQVAVAAAVTSITNANITDRRRWLASVGAVLPVASLAERAALTGLYEGYTVWRSDIDALNVYDGTGWRYFTRPTTNTVATSQNTASTSYVDLATVGPTVSIETGTAVEVTLTATLLNSASSVSFMAFAISGATTVAAADNFCIQYPVTVQARVSARYLITGLTAGTNTFTAKYRAAAGTATFADRVITVEPK